MFLSILEKSLKIKTKRTKKDSDDVIDNELIKCKFSKDTIKELEGEHKKLLEERKKLQNQFKNLKNNLSKLRNETEIKNNSINKKSTNVLVNGKIKASKNGSKPGFSDDNCSWLKPKQNNKCGESDENESDVENVKEGSEDTDGDEESDDNEEISEEEQSFSNDELKENNSSKNNSKKVTTIVNIELYYHKKEISSN